MKRILCYGDSNTWGHNPEPCGNNFRYGDNERWTGVLQRMLDGQAKIIEEGLCGRTIMYDDPVAADRNGSRFLNCCIQSHQPLDLVIFMLGTNDIRHIFTPSVKVPEVLVIVPAPVRDEIAGSEFYGMYDEESVRKSKALGKEYEKIFADVSGVTLLDAGTVAEVSVKDCIHLTGEGHRALGEAAAERVKKILKISG